MSVELNILQLSDYLSFKNGKSSPERYEAAPFPVYGANGVIGYSDTNNAESNAIIIGRVGSYCGSVHFSDEPCWVSDNAIICFSKNKRDSLFWFYFLKHAGLNQYRSGSGQPLLNQNTLNTINCEVPSQLDVRVRIGAFLATFDEKIELNRQTNETLEQIAQAIFKSWFVDFEPTRAKIIAQDMGADSATQELAAQAIICGALTLEQLADIEQNLATTLQEAINTKLIHNSPTPINAEQLATTAALFPNALVESELGEIPEGWVVCQIEEVLERLKPSKRYTKKQVSLTGQVPVYEQGADILLGFHNDEPSFIATPDNPAFIFGDHTCVTHLSCQNFDISQNVIPLRGKSRPTMWVYYAVQGQQLFQEYRRHWSELIVKPIIYPAADICEKYSAVITKLVCKKESLEREGQSLAELRDTLLPKLLSGELDVSALADDSAPAIKTKEAFDV